VPFALFDRGDAEPCEREQKRRRRATRSVDPDSGTSDGMQDREHGGTAATSGSSPLRRSSATYRITAASTTEQGLLPHR
jgi:hypothetical protein